MQVEIHGEETEQTVVVEAVLEYISIGHGLAGETMNKGCLEFSLCVVKDNHEDAQLLVKSQVRIAAVNLLAEKQK